MLSKYGLMVLLVATVLGARRLRSRMEKDNSDGYRTFHCLCRPETHVSSHSAELAILKLLATKELTVSWHACYSILESL